MKKALTFLSDPKYLQDVAYGSKPLTIGPGKVFEIPAVLRKYIPEKLWQEYQAKHSQIDAKGNIIPGTYTGNLTKTNFIDTLKTSTAGQQKNHVALDDKSERYSRTYTPAHSRTHTHTYIYARTHMHVSTHVYALTCMHARRCTYARTYMHAHTCTYARTYIHACTCTYARTCTYSHTSTYART